jgi:glucose-6-phosphate 1-dehydrogenase
MPGPLTVIIFGASGDLTSRKLVPALFSLFRKGRMADDVRVVGVSRSPLSHDEFRTRLAEAGREHVEQDGFDERWPEFARRVFYVPSDAGTAEGMAALKAWLEQHEGPGGGRRLYYLSVSPDLYTPITSALGNAGMTSEENNNWRRLVVEKPFGRDLASAKALNRDLRRHFDKQQIYRIDHYLGKETVQNILVLRFANTLFEPVWNTNYIEHVQITVSESVPVGSRGGYYDRSGVLRDMFQNHLLQLLTLVAMEAPARFAAGPLRSEKLKVLEAIPVPTPEEAARQVVVGQYAGYRGEKGVAADSRTPTFAAVRLTVENWRWKGIPFYLRSGKALASRYSEVIIQFRCPPHLMFPVPVGKTLECNRLSLCIQPDEGIHLNFQTKVPDEGMGMRAADLEFHYRDSFPGVALPEAYERLLHDALTGDAALFMDDDEIERAWQIMDPLIAAAERMTPELYPVSSHGPACSGELMTRDGRAWMSMCEH